MICAVILASSLDELKQQGEWAIENGAQMIECRLDALDTIEFDRIERFLKQNDYPIIFSIRSEWNNQQIDPPQSGRFENLKRLIQIRPPYVDLEFPLDMPLLKYIKEPTIPILSMLDFEGMAKIAFDSVVEVVKSYNGDAIIKISATPNSVSDLRQLWRWSKELTRENIPHVVIGMGQLGQITRVKSKELGNVWTYGRVNRKLGEPYLPGMLTIETLKNAFSDDSWHLAALGLMKEEDALKRIYELLLQKANLDGVFLNIPINTTPELDQLLLWISDGLLDGINITSPWQQHVMGRLDEYDSSAILMNSVNCITITKEGLKGYNTQVEGLRKTLEPYALKRLKRVYIDGTEQVTRAVIAVLREYAEQIVVRDKMFSQRSEIFKDFPDVIPASESYTDDYDLVVNCTKPDRGFENVVMIPKKIIENAQVIFDPMSKISTPTPLMAMATRLHKTSIGGFNFFFNTALSSFELWTKRSIPKSKINKDMFLSYQDQIDFGFMLNY